METKSPVKKFELDLSGLQRFCMFFAYVLSSINDEFYYKGHREKSQPLMIR